MNNIKDIDLKLKYLEYNSKYFNNELPSNVTVEWSSRLTANAGVYIQKKKNNIITEYIRLSLHYHEKFKEDISNTLIHEMIHVKYPKAIHGVKFKEEIKRLKQDFNLDILIHSKEAAKLNYKYICKSCGISYSRSNRDKKYKLKICRKCGSKFKELSCK